MSKKIEPGPLSHSDSGPLELRPVHSYFFADRVTQELAAIVESSDDAILTKDLNGIITSWNKGAERLFGYTEAETIGQSVTMLIPEDRHNEEPDILNRIRRGERIDHYETIRQRKDRSLVYISLCVSPLRDTTGTIIGASKIARDITERQNAIEQQQLLLKEMEHRVKNVFSLASALVSLCATRAETPQQLAQMVRQRLEALARAQALTVSYEDSASDSQQATTLHELLRTILSPHLDPLEESRLRVSGCDLAIPSKIVTPVALVLNELATNAVKYGALSGSSGWISFDCNQEDDHIALRWRERGGPVINAPPDSQGFGTRLNQIAVERQLGGTIQREWDRDGLTITLRLARENIDLP